jgi:cell shape-determining protein MreD
VIVLWAVMGIGLSLAFELVLGRFAPGATRYVTLMTLPLVAYALRTSQRSAMAVGCASGLLEDYWIEPRLFGLNGLVKTLLGWALGGVGAQFDLNNFWGRFASGASVSLVDEGLQTALRRLFGEIVAPVGVASLGIRAVAGGLLTAAVLAIVSRFGASRRTTRQKHRKA